jgi:hypothetical protein
MKKLLSPLFLVAAILFVMLFLPLVGVVLPSWVSWVLAIASLVALIMTLV